jgi:hypothetical protein
VIPPTYHNGCTPLDIWFFCKVSTKFIINFSNFKEWYKKWGRSNQKWSKAHPGYRADYRHRHPEYVGRNRILQSSGNHRRIRGTQPDAEGNMIAKVEALKVNIDDISSPYR